MCNCVIETIAFCLHHCTIIIITVVLSHQSVLDCDFYFVDVIFPVIGSRVEVNPATKYSTFIRFMDMCHPLII